MRIGSYCLYKLPRGKAELSAARAELHRLIREKCIVRSPPGKLFSPKGKRIGWLLDVRMALLDPEALTPLAALFWDEMAAHLPFQLVCTEVAGIPLMSALQSFGCLLGHRVNGVIVRKERKTYGRQRHMEGELDETPTVFVDDVLNSGTSLNRAATTLGTQGRSIDHIFTVVSFGQKETIGKWRQAGARLHAIFSKEDFGLEPSVRESKVYPEFFDLEWRFQPEGASLFDVVPKSSPVVDEERVYFGTDAGVFYALRQADGSVAWKYRIHTPRNRKGIWSSPTLMGERVVFGGYDGCVHALDRATGAVAWRFDQADWVGSSPCFAPDLNLLYVGLEHGLMPASKGSAVALDASTGERVWEYRSLRYIHASPLYLAGHRLVAIGDNGGDFNGLDAVTGELRWRFVAPDSIKSRPAYDERSGLIVFGCFDECVYAVRAETGEPAWSFATHGIVYSEPLIVDGRVFVASADKTVYVLDAATGESLDSVTTRGKTFGSPAAIGDFVYFGSTDGVVYKYDLKSGKLVGEHQLPEKITNRVAYSPAQGLYFVSTYDNHIFALRHKNAGRPRIASKQTLDAQVTELVG
jgi:outer membrane protein assembly factor BamB/orotate phosphoribosyltransferase